MSVKQYRRVATTVDVMRFEYTQSGLLELKKWMGSALGDVKKSRHIGALAEAQINTLEDGTALKVKHIATEGDYIIKGVMGEFWAVKPDIFELTYEAV